MNHEQAARFTSYLAPGETVRWTGQPGQGVRLRAMDAFLIPFSIVWCGFAIFWESLAIISGQWFMIIWGVPFVAVGLYLVAGRFAFDAFRRGRTVYALTNAHALILNGGSLTSIDLRTTPEIEFKRHGNGRGSIRFGPRPFGPWGADPWHAGANKSEFFQIDDAEAAYRLIQAAKT